MWQPFSLIVCFALTAALGIWIEQATLLLTSFLVICALGGQWVVYNFWSGHNRQIHATEIDIDRCLRMTAQQVRGLPGGERASIFLQILKLVINRAESKRGIEHHAILAAFRNRALEKPRCIHRLGKTMVSFGMAGTLVGLSMTMYAASDVVENAESVQALTAALVPAFGGLSMAFSTTLVAVLLGTVWLGSQAQHCHDAINLYFDQLDGYLGGFQFGDR
ncbi:hypothetical protein [Fuerstiella marisgermanici]|uniref:hypothetical protein n=1 Tax=Fuerstiella marisgermanici TaxID=1891926 RepID=UPI0011AB6E55|nr:hypothetical protein [Fuerstiella marisgermanici]